MFSVVAWCRSRSRMAVARTWSWKISPQSIREHDEDVENAERRGGHGEEVDGDHVVDVIPEKRLPCLGERRLRSDHVL
jgi:hypothetical protein